ncbi:MAG: HAMP domain-containing protein [Desulfuromonadaceae bacterium]|nr:HAMP domain-containing protein [Desulfuromonadaceae bacterium]
MAKPVGLRTEIIFHITLLLGAALLFGGFLMLKVTERELLNQRLDNLTGTMEVLALSVGETLVVKEPEPNQEMRVARLLPLLPDATALGVWKLKGDTLIPLYRHSTGDRSLSSGPRLQALRFMAEPQERLVYTGAWLAWGALPACYLTSTVPLWQRGKLVGVLQAQFSLDEVAHRVRSSLKILLLYVVLYGLVLFLFGLYLLNRNVVRPIGLLLATTKRVAAGDLDQQVSEAGPREIASLASSFNAMVAALRESRQYSEEHIRSLQRANEELQQTRSELLRSEKMATVGHLAAGMAHEVGNPLAAVVGYLALLKMELPAGRQREIAEHAAVEVERIDRLVRELLDYAKPGEEMADNFDPLTVLREALALLDHQGLFARVKLVDALPQQLPRVVMIRHRLLQVFVNLLVNAQDALPVEGEIHLTGGETDDSVWLSLADNGAGIAKQDLPHIFDPFFTTKAPGKGCGLGLAVCYRVLEEANGRIEVQSEAGQGSVFTVYMKREDAGHGV